MKFVPTSHVIGHIDALPLGSLMRDEKMFYQSTPAFVQEHGGPIARAFLREADLTGDEIVDIRIHHLQAGYYPAIPGWHLDWIPRIKGGQEPDMSVIPDYTHKVMIVGETSLTEFLDETFFPIPLTKITSPFKYVNDLLNVTNVRTKHVSSGDIIQFTSYDWHRPVSAEKTEWRMLIRASLVAHAKPVNEIRNTAQVYIPVMEASW